MIKRVAALLRNIFIMLKTPLIQIIVFSWCMQSEANGCTFSSALNLNLTGNHYTMQEKLVSHIIIAESIGYQKMYKTFTTYSYLVFCCFVCFEWTPYWKRESGYPIIRDDVSDPRLVLILNPLSKVNPGKKPKIPTSQTCLILIPHNNCNLIPFMHGTKQLGIWSDRARMKTIPSPGPTCTSRGYWNLSQAQYVHHYGTNSLHGGLPY